MRTLRLARQIEGWTLVKLEILSQTKHLYTMESGCSAVLMDTAIAEAADPIGMATAMKHAVIAGREGYLAGRMPKRMYAYPSSSLAGLI